MTQARPHTLPDPDLLASEMAWLRRVAGALVGPGGAGVWGCAEAAFDADDLAQDASLAALLHPPSGTGTALRRGWLARVVRHRAAQGQRRAARRRVREAAAARPEASAADDPAGLCARVEIHRHLADAVLALPAPLREAIVLRFFDGLPPREIARRTGVPVETVKSRLGRGLLQLRGRLQQRYGGDRALRAALLPLVVPAGLRAPAVLGSLLATGVLMKKTLACVVSLVLVGAAGWYLAVPPGVTPGTAPPPADPAPTLVAGAALPGGADDPDAGADAEARRTAVGAPPATPGQQPLRIQVVDAAGRPVAGVPVRVHIPLGKTVESVFGDRDFKAYHLGTTQGEDGMLTVTRRLSWGTDPAATTATVFADIHVRQPPLCELQREAMPAEPVHLVLPPTGEVVVAFRHASGQRLELLRRVRVGLKETAGVMPGSQLFPQRIEYLQAVSGEVRIPHVEPGLVLNVSDDRMVLDLDWTLNFVGEQIVGPTRAGEVATCTFVSDYPLLRGRLLAPDGRPVASSQVQLYLQRSAGMVGSSGQAGTLRTDAEGGFLVPVGWRARAETDSSPTVPVRRDLFLILCDRPLDGFTQPGNQTLFAGLPVAHARLPEVGAHGSYDLGDLELAPLGVVVAGQVVDASGRGLAGVDLMVSDPEPSAGARPPRTGRGLVGTRRSDATGRFAIPGRMLTDRLTVTAIKKGWRSTVQEVPVGAVDPITLRLLRGGRLLGTLRLDPGVNPKRVNLQLLREGERVPKYTLPDPSGAFAFAALLPGRYQVAATLDSVVLAEVPGLVVGESADCRDPRLDPFDLGGKIAVGTLELVDDAGQPLANHTLVLKPKDPVGLPGAGIFSGRTDAAGHCTFVGAARIGAFVLEVPSYLPREVVLEPGAVRQRLALRAALPLTVVLDAATPLPARWDFYIAELTRLDGDAAAKGPAWQQTGRYEGVNREFTFYLPGPGHYRVSWQVGAMRGEDGVKGFRRPIQLPVPGTGTREFDVQAAQRVEVHLDPSVLEATKQQLEERRAELLERTWGR